MQCVASAVEADHACQSHSGAALAVSPVAVSLHHNSLRAQPLSMRLGTCPSKGLGLRQESRGAAQRFAAQVCKDAKANVHQNGFSLIDAEHFKWQPSLDVLRRAAVTLMQHGWHASFLLMYDEAWALLENVRSTMVAGAPVRVSSTCGLCPWP